jgi:hypothetical protein
MLRGSAYHMFEALFEQIYVKIHYIRAKKHTHVFIFKSNYNKYYFYMKLPQSVHFIF